VTAAQQTLTIHLTHNSIISIAAAAGIRKAKSVTVNKSYEQNNINRKLFTLVSWLVNFVRRQLNITGAAEVKQTSMISTVLQMLRMTDTSLGWHQVVCSKCVDQRWRTTCHQMKSAYTVRGAAHCRLISFLDVSQCTDDKTPPGTPERDH